MSGRADVARTKVEIDVENHLLGTTVTLSDGTTGKVFSRGARNESNMFLYNCHLCSIPNLPGERCLQTHIGGRKHQTRLALPAVDAEAFRQPLQQKNKIQMNIAPGEPVPPGFENEVKAMAEIQKMLDVYKEQPLVALEYLAELNMGPGKAVTYHCSLCDKRGDSHTILAHITSQTHRQRFLEKHFPSVIKEIQPYRFPIKSRHVLGQLFQTVCEAIEDYHGRLTPNVHDGNDYNRNRVKYQQSLIFEKHIDESMGLKFTEVVDKKLIAGTLASWGEATAKENALKNDKRPSPSPPKVSAPKKIKMSGDGEDDVKAARKDRNSLDSISSISSGSVVEISPSKSRSRSPVQRRNATRPFVNSRYRRSISPPPQNRTKYSDFVKRGDSPHGRSSSTRDRRDNDSRRRPSPAKKPVIVIKPIEKKKIPTPKELSAQASEIAHERYKWEKYRCMVELAVKEMEKNFKEHEKNPEKHPMYPEEWKNFWNRRYKELQAEKKDPAKHDFKPEWIDFWTRRMKALHEEEIEAKKLEIRKKMNLPIESKERTDELKEQYIIKTKKKEKSPSPISDDDDANRDIHTPSTRRAERSRSRSRRSLSDDRDYDRARSRERDSRRGYDEYPSQERPYYKQYPPMHPYHYSGPPRVPQAAPHFGEWNRPYGAPYGGPPRGPYGGPSYGPGGSSGPGGAPEPEEDEGPLTFVSVCRLLTALEDHLGSLGPKVVDLMAKALALEKLKANSADDMLLNEDNCVFFETVKEKLKGQLQANVLHYSKINAVKRAIKNIASLIHQVTEKSKERKKADDAAAEISGKTEKIIIPTTSKANVAALAPAVNVERVAIAQKIAAALVAQGKTDITPEQLEQLIGFYTKMAEAAKEKEQPISTAAFLNDIERKKSPEVEVKEVPLKKSPPEVKKTTPPKKVVVVVDEKEKEDTATADATNALESLTDSDLQTLLQNFKDLSTDEQHHLIAYLKKLESTDPVRVEKLRKYVNIGGGSDSAKQAGSPDRRSLSDRDEEDDYDGGNVVVKSRKPLVSMQYDDDDEVGNFSPPIKHAKIFESDEEDDDYDFDDVVKTASKNVQNSMATVVSNNTPLSMSGQQSLQQRSSVTPMKEDEQSNLSSKDSSGGGPSMTLSDTQNLIANLMGSLQKSVSRIGPVTAVDTQTTTSVNVPQPIKPIQSAQQLPIQNQPILQSQNMNNVPYYYQQQQMQQQQQSHPQQQQSHPQQQQQQIPPQQQEQFDQRQQPFNNYPNQGNYPMQNNPQFGNYGGNHPMNSGAGNPYQQQQQQQQRAPQGYQGGGNVGYPQQNNMNNNYPRNNNYNNDNYY